MSEIYDYVINNTVNKNVLKTLDTKSGGGGGSEGGANIKIIWDDDMGIYRTELPVSEILALSLQYDSLTASIYLEDEGLYNYLVLEISESQMQIFGLDLDEMVEPQNIVLHIIVPASGIQYFGQSL
jgi:hypothetical protein